MQPIICIYKITNPKGKVYIGQSWNWENRYKWNSVKGCYRFNPVDPSQRRLYNSVNKYGWENHKKEIIVQFLPSVTQKELNDSEIYYINLYKSTNRYYGLNIREGGSSGKLSLESNVKQKRSIKKFQTDAPILEAIRQAHRVSALKAYFERQRDLGLKRQYTPEQCAARSERAKGRPAHNKGRKLSGQALTNVKIGARKRTKPVHQCDINGDIINKFASIIDAARSFPTTSRGAIQNCCAGRAHTAGGFKWKYAS